MKSLKKILALVLSVLLVICVFAGCSAESTGEENTEASNTAQKVAILQYMPHSSLDNCTQGVKNAL
ncbi:MAG: hypothetical protein ACI4RF_01285, partial [Eubacterium sp.]